MGRPRKVDKEGLEEIADQIEEGLELEEDEEHTVFDLTSYGSDVFDCIAGGGAPFGRFINIIGDNSTAKTLVASEIINKARKLFGESLVWCYDDAEAGYSFDSKALYGFDILDEDFEPSDTIEDFSLNFKNFVDKLKPDQKGIYILDSFDALTSIQEQEEFAEKMEAVEKDKKIKGTYAQGKAKGTNQFFRVMRNKIRKTNCLLIVISQVRENLNAGMFGKKFYRAGGKGLDMYASQIFWFYKAEEYEKKGTAVGVCIRAENTKNKVGKPYRTGYFDVLFDYGIDNISTNIKYLYDLKTETGKDKGGINKTELNWEGQNFTLNNLIRYIEDHDLERQLTRKVKNKWKDYEASISSERKRRF